MEVQAPAKTEYIPFFRLSEPVLGQLLPRLSDEQIAELVSNENWVPFPVSEEETKGEMENRLEPHIDLSLTEITVRLGIRCNPVQSVDKLRNILEEYHTPERNALVEAMNNLDDDFQTVVYAKLKEHFWFEKGEHQARFQKQTNQLDEVGIRAMLTESSKIRQEGKTRMKEENLSVNPETPVIEIAFITLDRSDKRLFQHKLAQLKPIYETCLKVKTERCIRAEMKKLATEKHRVPSRTAIFSCTVCGKQFSKEEARLMKFCDVDAMKIRVTFVYN
ncbi:MAG TPA: hypothetical protein VED17_08790 [Nitrososphaerales archaeon]|nr:hypothetical protein [Nitrososphaerales archaeon]